MRFKIYSKLLLFSVVIIAIIFSGCTGSQDITPVVKALPEVQQFMKEHPNAKITVTYWSKEEVAKSAQEISQQCDKSIIPVAMYKATISEEDLKIVTWIDAENRAVICSTTEGKQTATPTLTATATAIATPVRSDYLIPTTNLPAGFTYMGIHETPVEIGSFSINATEGVYRNNGEDFYILVIKNDDPEALITQYKARYKNARYDPFKEISFNGHKATQVTDYSTINGKQTQNFAVIWATEKTMIIVSSPTAALQKVIALATATPTPTATPAKFRVGPSVTLRPVIDVIEANQDVIVELFMNNPSLNDVTLNVDVRISVPSGIHVYGQSLGQAAGAGVVAGTFSVPPGTSRTIIVVVKADKSARIGSHNLQFTGLYYPGDNKDAFQPLSLTYSVTVKEPSKNPESPELSTPTATPAGVAAEIKGFAFNPTTITISKGTTVTWTNRDSAPHTITSISGAFDSGSLSQGQTYSHTFNEAGTFEYSCTIHPSIPHGKVIVTPTPVREHAFYRSDVDNILGFYRVVDMSTTKPAPYDINTKTLTINTGDSVRWVSDSTDYTITIMSENGLWESAPLRWNGQEFTYTFIQPGTYGVYIKEFPTIQHQKIIVATPTATSAGYGY